MHEIKLLFVSPKKSSFIQADLRLLARHFQVKTVDFFLAGQDIKGLFTTLCNLALGILWADVTVSWFAGWHSLWAVWLSRIFRKKSIVIAGGGEVADAPEIGYVVGSATARAVRYSLENANRVLAVSEFNRKEILGYVKRQSSVGLVYNGVDCNKFKPLDLPRMAENDCSGAPPNVCCPSNHLVGLEKSGTEACSRSDGDMGYEVVTVGIVNRVNTIRKGYECYVKAAHLLPNTRFAVVGSFVDDSIEGLRSLAPDNVTFTGFLPEDGLITLYQRAKVYCQLSYYETFGVALAEAMSCGCVPVVTSNAALPEVAGDTGFYVPYDDSEAVAGAIEKALRSGNGMRARERIAGLFSIEKREIELVNEIRCLCDTR